MELTRQKNSATYIMFPMVDANGDTVTGATGLDSEIEQWSDTVAPTGFVDCTNEATEVGTTGNYYLFLTAAEMNSDYIYVQVKSSNAKTQHILIQTIIGDPSLLSTTTAGTVSTAQTGDAFARLGVPAGASVSADILVLDNFVDDLEARIGTPSNLGSGATLSANLVDIESQTDDIGVAGAGLTALATQASVNTIDDFLDTEIAAIKAVTDLLPNGGALTTIQSDLDNIQLDTAAILVDTNELQTDWVNGGRLDNILDARASQTSLDDAKGATFNTATDSLEAIRDRGDAAWTTGAGGSDRLLMVDTTIATLVSQVSFTLTDGSADNDAYNNCTIVVEDAATSTQKAVGMVLDYVGSTKTVTLKEALAFTIAPTDKVYILAENSLKSTVANRQLDVTVTGAAGIDWGNIENPATANNLSGTNIDVDQVVASVSGAVASVTAGVTVGTNNDKAGYALSSAGVQAIWDALTSALTTAGTIGKLLVDNINATISSRSTYAGTDTAGTTTLLSRIIGTLAAGTHNPQSGDAFARIGVNGAGLTALATQASVDAVPTAGENADAVWDEAIAGHLGAGSTGEKLNSAGAAGDPWATALPGAYGAGTAGKIVGDNINATISSRASQTSVDTIDDFLDTEIADILADTSELQTDWANGGRLDNILDARASQASVDAVPTAVENADTLLKRDWSGMTGEAARSILNALRFVRNKFSTTATPGFVTVYKEDDTTVAYTKAVVTDAAAEPIVEG